MLRLARRAPAARLAGRWVRGLAVQKFPVPAMGDSITEGSVIELNKRAGEYVAQEEVLATVETDKVTVDVRSPAAGTIKTWFTEAGQTVIVGDDFVEIDVGVGDASSAASSEAAPEPAPAPAAEEASNTTAALPLVDGHIHPSGNPSLIRFRSAIPPPGTPTAPPAAAPPAPAAPTPAAPAAASPARAPPTSKVGAKGPALDPAELPARFRRPPISEEEMECINSGGADKLW